MKLLNLFTPPETELQRMAREIEERLALRKQRREITRELARD